MTNDELLAKFSEILGGLLGEDSVKLQMDTVRADIPGWDSFQYVNFIVAVEVELGVSFSISDVEGFQNVGDIVGEAQSLIG